MPPYPTSTPLSTPPTCPLHTSPPLPLTSICLYKSCPSYLSLCCSSCTPLSHSSHPARILPLSQFHKNLSHLLTTLTKKLKILSLTPPHLTHPTLLTSLQHFRSSITSTESKLLLCSLQLQKLHKDHIHTQGDILKTLEFINLNRNSQQSTEKLKELAGVVEYNFAKMRLEVNEAKGRKERVQKQRIGKEIEGLKGELREYMVKIIDVVLEEKQNKEEEYSITSFQSHLNQQILSLESSIKQSTSQLRSLQSKSTRIQQYLQSPYIEQPLPPESQQETPKFTELIINDDLFLEPSSSLMSFHKDEQREKGSVSMVYYETAAEDNRSVSCSIDLSRYEEGRGRTRERERERERMDKARIKGLEEENKNIRREKGELEIELVSVSNRLSALISELAHQKKHNPTDPNPLQSPQLPLPKRKLRLRTLQPLLILPSPDPLHSKYHELLALYTQLTTHYISTKDTSYLASITTSNLEEENKRLRKKSVQGERVINSMKKEIQGKEKEMRRVEGEREERERRRGESEERYQREIQMVRKEKEEVQMRLTSEFKREVQTLTLSHTTSITSLSTQITHLNSIISQLQSQIKSLQLSLTSSNAELAEYHHFITILQKEKRELGEHNEVLRMQSLEDMERANELDRRNIQLQRLVEQLQTKVKEGEKVREEKENIKRVLTKTLSQRKLQQNTKSSISQQLTLLQASLQQKQLQITTLQSTLSTLQTSLSSTTLQLTSTQHQLTLLTSSLHQKSSQLSELLLKITSLTEHNHQQQHLIKGEQYHRIKHESLLSQGRRLQLQLNEQKGKNRQLNSHIGELERRVKQVEIRITEKGRTTGNIRGRGDEFERVIENLQRDVNVLEGKLKDKELIEKIYIKELEGKKQEIAMLNRHNDGAGRAPVFKKDVMKGNVREKEVKQKENKGLKKYMSFRGEY